ncbi:hypothetical protein E2986_13528 [Frieseomelitta varia]|uniref:Uncharacterized protein n=1 Tax=Frieseomelitta varia TaxID=561572 RepID=A0A833VWY3_9HYME|nr:hypothetical protein E2986_13528 [Frieseomelitta varia]
MEPSSYERWYERMNGQSAVVFLYLGEFQPTKYRDKMLSWMEMAWVVGMIILAGVGWIVIPLEVSIEKDDFFFHSWNLFVFICSLPALLTGAWLLFFPETPKYLAESGNNVQMLDVLMRMYSENSGEPPKEYIVSPYHHIHTSVRHFPRGNRDFFPALKLKANKEMSQLLSCRF